MKRDEMSMKPEQIRSAAGERAARSFAELVNAGQIMKGGHGCTDRRTISDADGVPHVLPFSVESHAIRIVCPYCGELHTYDRAAAQYAGHYKARCVWLTVPAIYHGLYIETS